MNDIHVHVEGTVQTLAHLYNMGPTINPSLGATSQELHFRQNFRQKSGDYLLHMNLSTMYRQPDDITPHSHITELS